MELISTHFCQCSMCPDLQGWWQCTLPEPVYICTFLTSAFILQTYPVSHKEVLLIINYSDYVFNLYLNAATRMRWFMMTGRVLYSMDAAFWNYLSPVYISNVRGTSNWSWSLHNNCLDTFVCDRNWVRYNTAMLEEPFTWSTRPWTHSAPARKPLTKNWEDISNFLCSLYAWYLILFNTISNGVSCI